MSLADGPLGPGLQRCGEDEKSRRYFRSTKARRNFNSVAGLTSAPSFAIRRGLANSAVSPSTKRSSVVRFGARCLDRLLIRSWCLSSRDSAATARTPPGRSSFASVTRRWTARMRSSRIERTVTSPPVRARLHAAGELRHTTNSPPTGQSLLVGFGAPPTTTETISMKETCSASPTPGSSEPGKRKLGQVWMPQLLSADNGQIGEIDRRQSACSSPA